MVFKLSPAIKKEPRKIVLMYSSLELIGYFQYYTTDKTFMMEEIQIKREHHGKGVFREFYSWLMQKLSWSLCCR